MSGRSKNLTKAKEMDNNDVEMVFGASLPHTGADVKPDIHTITNEKKPKQNLPNNGTLGSESDTAQPTQPLLEADRSKPKPPIAGPEIDDLDDDKPLDAVPYPGIDDGLLDNPTKPDVFVNGVTTVPLDEDRDSTRDDAVGTDDGKWWTEPDQVDGPYDGINGFGPRFGLDDRPGSPMIPGVGFYDDIWSIPDVNTYQQKKNLAQGMMDLALLSANANQLRYVLESSQAHPYYYPSLVFISLSIIFQIAVGVGLIMNSRYNVKNEKDICIADKINNMTVLGIFLITIVNVFITSFSVANQNTPPL